MEHVDASVYANYSQLYFILRLWSHNTDKMNNAIFPRNSEEIH